MGDHHDWATTVDSDTVTFAAVLREDGQTADAFEHLMHGAHAPASEEVADSTSTQRSINAKIDFCSIGSSPKCWPTLQHGLQLRHAKSVFLKVMFGAIPLTCCT